MQTWAHNLLTFYNQLEPPQYLPNNIQWLHPQKNKEVKDIANKFFQLYYNDAHRRIILLGINPGRFGAGVTGINFTAPQQLTADCGIAHPFKQQSELSAEFIYDVIRHYGGPHKFYHSFFIGSVSPLGFIKDGRNLNYYDDKELLAYLEPFIISQLENLVSFNVYREKCFCIGGEKNYRYIYDLNAKKKWFKEIVPLPHPRYIMQYKRKEKKQYIMHYLELLANN